nr:hypothetical protein [Tanacetum cinerariifolium]
MDLLYDELLCSFLERFPTYQLRSKPRDTKVLGYCNLSVFSSKDEEGYQNNSYSSSDDNEQNCWPEIRSSGPPLSAFLNGLPEILSSVHHEESELMSSLLIPIFHPSGSSSSDCIGVVECFSREDFDIMLFSEMNKALE